MATGWQVQHALSVCVSAALGRLFAIVVLMSVERYRPHCKVWTRCFKNEIWHLHTLISNKNCYFLESKNYKLTDIPDCTWITATFVPECVEEWCKSPFVNIVSYYLPWSIHGKSSKAENQRLKSLPVLLRCSNRDRVQDAVNDDGVKYTLLYILPRSRFATKCICQAGIAKIAIFSRPRKSIAVLALLPELAKEFAV